MYRVSVFRFVNQWALYVVAMNISIIPYDAMHKIYVATYTSNKNDISWKEVMDDLFEEKQWIFLSPMITQSVHLFYNHITCI